MHRASRLVAGKGGDDDDTVGRAVWVRWQGLVKADAERRHIADAVAAEQPGDLGRSFLAELYCAGGRTELGTVADYSDAAVQAPRPSADDGLEFSQDLADAGSEVR